MSVRSLVLALLLVCAAVPVMALKPDRHYVMTPQSVGLSYDSVNIRTSDGKRLTGWYCHPDSAQSRTIVVLAGGDGGNMSYDAPLAAFIAKNFGLAVLLFDYREFGTSDEAPYDSNAIGMPAYLRDYAAAVDWVTKEKNGSTICLYGRSLGASLALVLASRRRDILAVVAESPYASQSQLAGHIKLLRLRPRDTAIAPIVSADLEPMENIGHFAAPHLLVLRGANERFILSNELEQLVNKAPAADRQIIDIPGCDHLEMPMKRPQEFGEALAQFLIRAGVIHG